MKRTTGEYVRHTEHLIIIELAANVRHRSSIITRRLCVRLNMKINRRDVDYGAVLA